MRLPLLALNRCAASSGLYQSDNLNSSFMTSPFFFLMTTP
jgi:hypothetical protein